MYRLNITYNRAGCDALMRGIFHSQSSLSGSYPIGFTLFGVCDPKNKGICSVARGEQHEGRVYATPKIKGYAATQVGTSI